MVISGAERLFYHTPYAASAGLSSVHVNMCVQKLTSVAASPHSSNQPPLRFWIQVVTATGATARGAHTHGCCSACAAQLMSCLVRLLFCCPLSRHVCSPGAPRSSLTWPRRCPPRVVTARRVACQSSLWRGHRARISSWPSLRVPEGEASRSMARPCT